MNTEPIAAFRPVWASEMTSCTPASPRAFSERRNAVQNAPSSRVADVEPEDLTAAVGGDAGGDHHRLGHHPAVDPGLAVGRVEEHVRVGDVGQGPVPERADLLVEVRADPGDLGLGDPGVGAQRLDQVVDLAGRDPVQVGLHDHREQRLVDPPPPLEQRGEERPRPQLGDPQLQVTRGRGQRPRPATRCAGRSAPRCVPRGRRRSPRSARRRSTPGRSSGPRCGPGPRHQPACMASSTSSSAALSKAIVLRVLP